jgi:hypothetical protein
MPRLQAPTSGLRLAIWFFPVLTIWLGLAYTFGPSERLQSPAFTVAKEIMPMKAWGVLFLVGGLFKLSCILFSWDRWFMYAMCIGMGIYTWWAFMFGVSFFLDENTSPGSVAWPLFVVASHAATLSTMTSSGVGSRRDE